jgi:RNA polymerase sigma-70 factor (ECF subfamily)
MPNNLYNNALSTRLLLSASTSERALPHVEETVGLFSSLRRPLLRYVLTFGVGIGEGEEIVQESFLALFEHLKCGKSQANLPGWIFRVCHNLALKHMERTRGVQKVISTGIDWRIEFADQALNPEEQLLQVQRRQKLQSVLRALPEQDRCCICLRAEGLRYREIASVLGMSLGSVSISLTRSLARLERADQE